MEARAEIAKPNIFEYDNYRLFLADTYHYLKETKSFFSFRYFSKTAGFASPNFFKLVMEGKRNLSQDSVERFALALKLNKSESEFFGRLVSFNQASNAEDKGEFANQLLKSRSYRKIHPLNQALFHYYSRWYFVAIREMVAWKDFREDAEWIAARLNPAVTPGQALDAIEELLKLQMLVRGVNGRLQQADAILNTDNEVASQAIRGFHKEMIRLASESIERFTRLEREISSVTVPVSAAGAQKVKELVQNFRTEILAVLDAEKDTDRVYQLNFQFFPVAKDGEE
ncbi:MAG: TIGR02147 family protein [Bdellovibrionia bacterium]